MTEVGVDACKGGWAVVVVRGDAVSARFAPVIADVQQIAPDADVIVIDIPIGFVARGRRAADEAARRQLAKRASTLFFVPPRAVLEIADYDEAVRLSHELMGHGISRQSHALRGKVMEVDEWLARDTTVVDVFEGHPELSFATLLGRPVQAPKKTWEGFTTRRDAVEAAGVWPTEVDHDLGVRAGVDDVLDAAIMAWTARRVLAGVATSYPDPPEIGDGARRIAIRA